MKVNSIRPRYAIRERPIFQRWLDLGELKNIAEVMIKTYGFINNRNGSATPCLASGPCGDRSLCRCRAIGMRGDFINMTRLTRAASWFFYSASKGADKTGPMAGVPYDGNDPKYGGNFFFR